MSLKLVWETCILHLQLLNLQHYDMFYPQVCKIMRASIH